LEEENFFCSGKFAFRTCSDIIAEKEGGGGGGGKYIMGITHFCLLFPLRERKTLREKQIREGKGEMKGEEDSTPRTTLFQSTSSEK
jgi:hypothetical protein